MFFSVIVPIYGVEKYLPRCIKSVLSQTFRDFELILVDDGSEDGCARICDEYAEKDGRIKVIHKKNGGLVSARKAGVKIASGEYVFHLDGDDALTDDALESAKKIIDENGADIVSFSYIKCIGENAAEKTDDYADEGFYNKENIKKELLGKIVLDENMRHLFYFVWGRAIKRSLLEQVQMSVYDKISLGEDLCCTAPLFIRAQSVYMSRKAVYLYTVRDDSMTTSFNANQINRLELVIKYLRESECKLPPEFDGQISRYFLFMCFAILADAAEGGHFEAAGKLKRLIVNSPCAEEIQKSSFKNITKKSRIAVWLIKRKHIRTAFYFLNFCGRIKNIKK